MRPLTVTIVLSVLFVANLGATEGPEPNNVGSEPKFEISKESVNWTVELRKTEGGQTEYARDPGPVKPTHAARVLLHREYVAFTRERAALEKMLESPAARKFSKSQREFLETEFGMWIDDESLHMPYHYYSNWLYAVSAEDARLMAEAFLDSLNELAGQKVDRYKRQLGESQQELRLAQEELPEKQAQLKACEEQYKPVKESMHGFSSDDEAAKLAGETIIEMDKTLDTIEIELAGIREKLSAIEKYRKRDPSEDFVPQVYYKLDEMFVEQMIELRGLEARRAMTGSIRGKQQRFLGLFNERRKLRSEVSKLSESIRIDRENLDFFTGRLDKPTLDMLPPKVYQNTITIHPVRADDM